MATSPQQTEVVEFGPNVCCWAAAEATGLGMRRQVKHRMLPRHSRNPRSILQFREAENLENKISSVFKESLLDAVQLQYIKAAAAC